MVFAEVMSMSEAHLFAIGILLAWLAGIRRAVGVSIVDLARRYDPRADVAIEHRMAFAILPIEHDGDRGIGGRERGQQRAVEERGRLDGVGRKRFDG